MSFDTGDEVGQVLWSPDGKQLAAVSGNTVKLWDAAAGYEFADSHAYRLEQAQLLAVRERFAEARVLLERWIAQYPAEKPIARRFSGTYYREGEKLLRSDTRRAVAAFTEALRLDPGGAYCLVSRAIAYQRLHEFDKEMADITEAIRLDPRDAVLRRFRAREHYEKHDYDKAIADLTETIRLDANDEAAFEIRGNVYYQKGEQDEAIADFCEAIRLDPKSDAYILRARVYAKKGDYHRALADCTEGLCFGRLGALNDPGQPREVHAGTEARAALVLAEVHAGLGHKDLARGWYNWGVAWMDKNPTEAKPLLPYRADVEKALGIGQKK